jgi:magnesium transporter
VAWLLVLFVAGTLTSFILQSFEDALLRVVALSFFVPLLIGTGGNVGSQIVTTVARALAVGDVTTADTWRVVRRELVVGLCLSVVMALAMFLRAHSMGVGPGIALVVTLSAICIVLWAAFVAALLPLLLQRVGVDPAVVSAPLIITVVDGTGLLMYLLVAQQALGV